MTAVALEILSLLLHYRATGTILQVIRLGPIASSTNMLSCHTQIPTTVCVRGTCISTRDISVSWPVDSAARVPDNSRHRRIRISASRSPGEQQQFHIAEFRLDGRLEILPLGITPSTLVRPGLTNGDQLKAFEVGEGLGAVAE